VVVNQPRSVDNGPATSFLSSLVLLTTRASFATSIRCLAIRSLFGIIRLSSEERVGARCARVEGKEETMWAPRPRDDLSYREIVYVQALCLARNAYADSCYCNVDIHRLSSTWSSKKNNNNNSACVTYALHFPFSASPRSDD